MYENRGGNTARCMLPFSVVNVTMTAFISCGCVNYLLMKEVYTAYGEKYSQFVNQSVNFLYVAYGGFILCPRMILTDAVTLQMRCIPKKRFFIMGFLDALGTFFIALGAAYTPGSMQPILSQTLTPWIIMMSWLWLRKLYSARELAGAAFIMAGACLSALPRIVFPHSEEKMRPCAVLLFACSTIPMAMSTCYKEGNFAEQDIDVWYLTQWVSAVQFSISFLLLPLLCIPHFGTNGGTALSDLPGQFHGGWLCTWQLTEDCKDKPTLWLLLGYSTINILYTTLGLYLVKMANALVNGLSCAILLPCTTILFFTPVAGNTQEMLTPESGFTVFGLAIALYGLGMFQRSGQSAEIKDLPGDLVQRLIPDTDDGLPTNEAKTNELAY